MRSLLVLCLFVLCFGCSSTDKRTEEWKRWKAANGKVKALSTIGMIDDVVKEIGGEFVDTHVLIPSQLDPHSYQLVKGDNEKFDSADIIFFNGLGLENGHGLSRHLNNGKGIALGNTVLTLYPECGLFYEGNIDPHLWMDISLWAKTIPIIVEALSKKDPAHREIYQARGDKLAKQFQIKHEEVRTVIQSIPEDKRYLVTSHDAFHYFTRAYMAEQTEKDWNKRFKAPEGLSPESQLSPVDIQMIIDHLTKHGISTVFAEANVSKDSLRKIRQAGMEKGVKVAIAEVSLYADALGAPGSEGDTYLKMIQHNASIIHRFLTERNSP